MHTLAMSRNRWLLLLAFSLLSLFFIDPVFASNTSGGGLPSDDWMTTIMDSVTGPWAYAISVIAVVGAGVALIFGHAEMNGFLKTLIFLVLVLSFVIAAKNTISAVTGQGAEISAPTTTSQSVNNGGDA